MWSFESRTQISSLTCLKPSWSNKTAVLIKRVIQIQKWTYIEGRLHEDVRQKPAASSGMPEATKQERGLLLHGESLDSPSWSQEEPTIWAWISSLQSCETVSVSSLSHLVCSVSQQSPKTNPPTYKACVVCTPLPVGPPVWIMLIAKSLGFLTGQHCSCPHGNGKSGWEWWWLESGALLTFNGRGG